MPVYKYKTKNGIVKWYAAFWYTDWSGKKKKKKKEGFLKRAEALAFEREFLLQNNRSCDMTFSSLIDLYLVDSEHRIRVGTRETQKSIIEKWIIPFFGDLPVSDIDAVTIRAWQNSVMASVNPRSGRPYAPTYIRTINSRLSAIFNFAVRFYGLPVNPCLAAGFMGKKKAGRMDFWTLTEFGLAMDQVSNWSFRLAFNLVFWLGLREGECLALQPADILPSKMVRVDKTHHRRSGENSTGPPKTDNSIRDVSMPDFLYEEVQRYLGALHEVEDEDRIFYFQKGTLGRVLDDVSASAGVKRIRVHDLRHSHAAHLVELGYSIVAVAERLGDTVEVAMSTYAHLYPDKMDQVVADLNTQASLDPFSSSVVPPGYKKLENEP